jgi:group I intron endonuclease
MLGYKHTAEAVAKMKKRLENKINHPMYKKTHNIQALKAISKPGKLNPMYNKIHSIEIRKKMSISNSKNPLGLYNIENNLVKIFMNQVELAAEFIVFKSTISRYIKSGKIFKNKYFIRKLNK